MLKTLSTFWPLFFGLLMLMIGNGLQGTLLGVRASIEGFSLFSTGVVMSVYYVGFLAGSLIIPRLIGSVGHIRVFAALASLASTTVLFHGLFPNPILWTCVRIVTGFSYAGLFIVIESWLNNETTNKMRGKVLALYMILLYAGVAIGQGVLTLADPAGMTLFIISSVLVSLALLPISLSSRPAPSFSVPETISLKTIYKKSPLGVIGVSVSGFSSAILFSIMAVFASEIGMSVNDIAMMMGVFVLGGVAFQMPIGYLSDYYDRRLILISISGITCLCCLFALMGAHVSLWLFLPVIFVLGGMSLSLYALAIAHTNDHLDHKQILAASATLVFVNGFFASLGPLVMTGMMDWLGPDVYFVVLAFSFAFVTAYGLYRMQVRDSVPLAEQTDYTAVHAAASPVVMQLAEDEMQMHATKAGVQEIAHMAQTPEKLKEME